MRNVENRIQKTVSSVIVLCSGSCGDGVAKTLYKLFIKLVGYAHVFALTMSRWINTWFWAQVLRRISTTFSASISTIPTLLTARFSTLSTITIIKTTSLKSI